MDVPHPFPQDPVGRIHHPGESLDAQDHGLELPLRVAVSHRDRAVDVGDEGCPIRLVTLEGDAFRDRLGKKGLREIENVDRLAIPRHAIPL
jgi:hypothetical protein